MCRRHHYSKLRAIRVVGPFLRFLYFKITIGMVLIAVFIDVVIILAVVGSLSWWRHTSGYEMVPFDTGKKHFHHYWDSSGIHEWYQNHTFTLMPIFGWLLELFSLASSHIYQARGLPLCCQITLIHADGMFYFVIKCEVWLLSKNCPCDSYHNTTTDQFFSPNWYASALLTRSAR